MKVLLVRLSALGDLVIMTSALEYLKDKADVTLLTKSQYFGLFEKDTRVKRLVDEKSLHSLKNEVFDVVCDLHAKPKTFLMLKKIHAAQKCVVNKRWLQRRLAVWFKKKIEEIPLYKLYVKPLHRFFPDKSYPLPKLNVDFNEMPNMPKKYVVVFPGASQIQKMWPFEYFFTLSKMIYREFGMVSVYMGAESFPVSDNDFIMDLTGKKSLLDMMSIIKHARFTVSNDSGPAHMSAALSVPLFVFFGPTIPEFGFRPVSVAPVFLFERKNLSCRPCSLHGERKCRFGDLRCLAEIRPENVMVSIRRFLRNN